MFLKRLLVTPKYIEGITSSQESVYTKCQRQPCDDANNTALIEKENGVTLE